MEGKKEKMKVVYVYITLQIIMIGLLVGNFYATFMQTEELQRLARVEAEGAVQRYRVADECQKFNQVFSR